ncbi:MAG: wax ester/triacylglycerol synthase family O-acyltransferase, partial [Spongiibacteraceae bacterium]
MHQLSAADALMTYRETNRTPMHVSPFFIYDMSTAPNKLVRFKDIIKAFESRLPEVPKLRQKLLRVPFDLDEPYWIDDESFELEQHIRHFALPKPGDRRQLSILLARIHSDPMDLNRPPWDACVIEGLDQVDGIPKGSFGMLLRIHHSALDGHSGHGILQALHDLGPSYASDIGADKWRPRKAPPTSRILRQAAIRALREPTKMVDLMAKTLPVVRGIRTLTTKAKRHVGSAVETRFNKVISARRVVVLLTLELEGLRVAKNIVDDATINDAIVCVVAGAMRRYLEAKGELPEESLITALPINIHSKVDRDNPGNMVAMSMLDMHSDIEQPLLRLKKIHESAVQSRVYSNAVGANSMSESAVTIPGGIMSAGARVAASEDFGAAVANTCVTNVPGPVVPLYMAGAKLVEFHGLGVLLDGLGLYHSVNSYCGRVAITVLADRDMMSDPHFYEQCLLESYEDLCKAAQQHLAATKAKPAWKFRARTKHKETSSQI